MKDEIKRILKSKMLMATLVAVVILPLIYGGLYLWAFWDPYGKMENLPVAVVNEDKCAYKSDKKDKKQYCFGQELVDKLKDEKAMNWLFVDEETAISGLQNKKYYTMAVIPKDFSENILSVDGDNPQKAQIEFRSRQASSFMASKFTDTAFVKIKAALNEKIDKEYFDNIFSETRDSVKDLQKAADGASDLGDGIKKAKDGSDDLYDGIDKVNSGAVDLRNGLNTLYDGADKTNEGAKTLYNGISQTLLGAKNLNSSLLTLSAGTSQMISATTSLSSGQSVVIAEINAYLQAHPEASASTELMTALGAATQVNGGLSQLNSSLNTMGAGGVQLVAGSNSLVGALNSLSVGSSDIATASGGLKDGLKIAKDGSNDLISGLEEIKEGQKDLGDGLADADDGAKELKDKLNEAVNKNISKINEEKNKTQAEVMSAPVDIHDISIDIVNNNGTGFAPYFIPLSLWVGSMAIFFLVEVTLNNKKVWQQFWPKLGLSSIVALMQASTLNLVLIKLLGLKVSHTLSYLIFTLLLAICFMLIQMFLTLSLGLAGKFVGIVLLMLQLTSSAGSYPIETAPEFFQKIGPYLPMTYAVSALREVISGGNYEIINADIKVILIYCLISILAICLYLLKKSKILSVKNLKKWQFLPIKKRK